MSERTAATAEKADAKNENAAFAAPRPGFAQAPRSPFDQVMFLQRTIGNQVAGRFIQAKLKVSEPGDIYEQEADRVAEQVTRMPEPVIQRQEEKEEEKVQTKPLASQITPLLQRQSEEEEKEEEEQVQAKFAPGITAVQRQAEEEEKKKDEEETVQTQRVSDQSPVVAPRFEASLNAIRSGGQPLPESARSFFEPRFGADFSQVHVHTDAAAADLARSVNAKAFTIGRDIVFNAGHYPPGGQEGRHLLAHELTHAVQQLGLEGSRVGQRAENRGLTSIPATISPPIQRKKTLSPPTKQSSSASAKKQRQFFIDRLIPALGYVASQYDNLASKTEGLAVLYHKAWERHTKVLSKADANERIVGDFILDSALAFIPGGIGGVVGKWMGGIKGSSDIANAFISDGVKDLVKITLRRQISKAITESEGFREGPQAGHTGPAFKAIGDDPFTWRGTAMKNVLAEKSFVEATVTAWAVAATNDVNNKFIYDWDPYVFVQEVIRIDKTAPENLPEPTEQQALIFEKGFWKGWIDKHRYYLVELGRGHGVAIGDRAPAEIDVVGGLPAYLAGQKIRERIKALAAELREDGETWLKQWGIESMKKLEAERVKRNKKTFGATVNRGLKWLFGVDDGQ